MVNAKPNSTRGETKTGTETIGSTGTERRIAVIALATLAAQLACDSSEVPPTAPPRVAQVLDAAAGDATAAALDSGSTDAGALDASTQVADAAVLPCGGAPCGANAMCDVEHDQCVCNEGYEGTPQTGCTEVVMGAGWIGSPCNGDGDCDFADGVCQTDASGYPAGHCSVACDRLCPDRDGHAVTFCIQPPSTSDGTCVARCDSVIHPRNMGCRDGYRCTPWRRHNQTSVSQNVCVPDTWAPPERCADLQNHAQDDDCYFAMISFGDPNATALARGILGGTASAQEAETWLDLNFDGSQRFVTDELGRTIHDNFSAGHRASQPMVGMIVHYTAAQREDGTIRYFVGASPHASTHFVVGSERNGLIVQIFSHRNRTWHAGSTYNADRFGFDFANAGYLNPRSGGGFNDYADRRYAMDLPVFGSQPVEITDGIPGADPKYGRKDYWQPYTYYQIISFVLVGRALHLVYGLQTDQVERHGDVAGSRVDPGPALPLTYLKALIFSSEDVFTVDWLAAYKTDAAWIVANPQAR